MSRQKEIVEIVKAAGEIIREHFHMHKQIQTKSTSIDLVTEVDKQVELYLKKEFSALIPGSAFLSEETDSELKEAEALWVIDPIDGTTNFVHGFPFVCVSVALQIHGITKHAVVYNPIMEELFSAEAGQGSYKGDIRLRISKHTEFTDCLFATGFPYHFATTKDNNICYFEHFHRLCQGVRRPGSAALDLCYVAAGIIDGYWEWHLKPWDCAAGILIVQEAGGVVTNFEEQPYRFGDKNLVAANPDLHRKMLNEIAICRNSQ